MNYRRILTIQDISCVGQCSMTVALPILSACGQECCVLPTAVLSTHTGGFGKPEIVHLTQAAEGMWRHWKTQNITFDAVLVGYLGSLEAIGLAHRVLDNLLAEDGLAIIDPAMADHGKLYSGFDKAYVEAMKGLCSRADILMPNITEAAMLTETEYRDVIGEHYVNAMLDKIGVPRVVLTGVGFSPDTTGVLVKEGQAHRYFGHRKVGGSCHGTGDIFAACFTGSLMWGKNLDVAVKIAAEFTANAIEKTVNAPAHWYGVKFEATLPELMSMLYDEKGVL